MSPPDLGTILHDLNDDDGVGSIRGIAINPLLNLTNGTDVGVVVQIPSDQLVMVNVLSGSPFHVNIANGFTQISGLESNPSNYNYYCGYVSTNQSLAEEEALWLPM